MFLRPIYRPSCSWARLAVPFPHRTPSNRLPAALLHVSTPRRASPQNWQDSSSPLVEQLRSNPHIMKKLFELTTLMQSKGLDITGKPSFMQIMKIYNDSEVKQKVKDLVEDMQKAGIELDMKSIAELQGNLNQQAQDEDSEESTDLNRKLKNLFKK